MKITEIIVILEVENHHQGNAKTIKRIENAVAVLMKSAIAGCRVLFVFAEEGEKPTQVPCYSHDLKCGRKCCNPLPWGVSRIFGLKVLVAGELDINALDTYHLTEHSRICVSGYSDPVEVEGFAPDLKTVIHSDYLEKPALAP